MSASQATPTRPEHVSEPAVLDSQKQLDEQFEGIKQVINDGFARLAAAITETRSVTNNLTVQSISVEEFLAQLADDKDNKFNNVISYLAAKNG